MKTCSRCKLEKQFCDFSKKSASKDGYSGICKDCHNSYVRSVWYPKNKAAHLASVKKYKEENKSKTTAHRLGVCSVQVENLFREFESCQICGCVDDLCVDHCHETNNVRGLLCRKCNSAIAMLGDSKDEVLSKLENIEKYFSS